MKTAKSRFYQHMFEKTADNPRKTWRQFNELNAMQVSDTPSELVIHWFADSEQDLVNVVNNHLANTGAGNFPPFLSPDSSLESYTGPMLRKSVFLTPTSEDEENLIITSFDNRSAAGHDDIKAATIKETAHIIATPLAYICNRVLASGIFPA